MLDGWGEPGTLNELLIHGWSQSIIMKFAQDFCPFQTFMQLQKPQFLLQAYQTKAIEFFKRNLNKIGLLSLPGSMLAKLCRQRLAGTLQNTNSFQGQGTTHCRLSFKSQIHSLYFPKPSMKLKRNQECIFKMQEIKFASLYSPTDTRLAYLSSNKIFRFQQSSVTGTVALIHIYFSNMVLLRIFPFPNLTSFLGEHYFINCCRSSRITTKLPSSPSQSQCIFLFATETKTKTQTEVSG